MKRIMTAIASLALLAGLASCQKEGTGKGTAKQTEEVEITQVNLTASFLKTRVSYAETGANNLQPSWVSGDKIFCYDGNTFYPLTVGTVNEDGSASIFGEGPASGPVALLYKNDLNEAPTNLPLEIDYDGQNGGEAMPNVLFASGTITDGTGKFEFKSAGSVVGVSYAKSLANNSIKSITISGTNLSGAEVTYEGSAFTLTATVKDSDAITTADLTSKSITVGNDGVFSEPVFIAVPVGATISKVTVTSTDDGTDTKDLSSSPKTVEANQYLYVKAPEAPKGVFSVSATKKVQFSKGNLWADASGANASNPVLHFEESQYAFNSNYEASHVSLFTWSDNFVSAVGNSISGSNHFCDENHKVSVDGSEAIYYALSMAEWAYLLGTVVNGGGYYVPDESTGVRYLKFGLGNVCDKNGMIILPDDWTKPSSIEKAFVPSTLNDEGVPQEDDPFNQNKYNAEQWSAMESAGAVFLPAAGYRNGSDMICVGSHGFYWSSTAYDEYYAYSLLFYSERVYPGSDDDRISGFSARLVSDCN